MVISGLATALVMSGSGVMGNSGGLDDSGFAHRTGARTSPAVALVMTTPLPSEIRQVLSRKQWRLEGHAANSFAQEIPGPLPAPAAPGEQPPIAIIDDESQPADEQTGGEIIVSGEVGAPKGDPAEQLNAFSFEVVDAVDMAVVEPIADAYGNGIPEPIRDGVDNFLSNLGEPVSALHYLLQLKPGKALKTLGRFAINTTLGIGGVFDIAAKEPFYLEYEPNGLANTLGYYGVGPGPYLYLPLIGSTTVRDLVGRTVDLAILPAVAGKPFNSPYYVIPAGTLDSLNDRVDKDAQIASVREKCGDPYAAERDLYLVQREAEIQALKGNRTPDLGEIGERLEFNCDIQISGTPTGVSEQTDFVRESTTLIDGSQGSEAAAEGAMEPKTEQPAPTDSQPAEPAKDPATETPVPADPQPKPADTQPEPADR